MSLATLNSLLETFEAMVTDIQAEPQTKEEVTPLSDESEIDVQDIESEMRDSINATADPQDVLFPYDVDENVVVASPSDTESPPVSVACLACNERCADVLVKCLECNMYFCRAQQGEEGTAPSHWAFHHARAKHQRACFFPSTDHEWTLECDYCHHESKVSELGFFTPAVWDAETLHTPLACRTCACDNKKAIKRHAGQMWVPVLCRDSDEFNPEFLGGAPPHACDQTDKRQPTTEDLERMEHEGALRITRAAIAKTTEQTTLPRIPASFETPAEMMDAFMVVMQAESEAQKQNDADSKIPHCPGSVTSGHARTEVVLTMVTAGSLQKLSEVVLEFETAKDVLGDPIVWEGYVKRIDLDISTRSDTSYRCIIVITQTLGRYPQTLQNHLFSVANKYAGVSFARMQAVLNRMRATEDTIMDPTLQATFLHGGNRPAVLPAKVAGGKVDVNSCSECDVELSGKGGAKPGGTNIPLGFGYKELNTFQRRAVRHALENPVTLIQGPPGTGKTSTCVVSVALLHQLSKSKVLVCAGSNTAVDHLTTHLVKLQKKNTAMAKVNILRVEAYSIQGNCADAIMPNSLFQRTNTIIKQLPASNPLRQLHEIREAGDGNWERLKTRYEALRRQVELRVLRAADIVCATCVTTGNGLFLEAGLTFEHVLMDEACQILEPESFIPLQHGAKRVVLVGDQCQLDPMVRLRTAKVAGLSRSLFERLLEIGAAQSLMLQKQYRMHPAIAQFPSQHFYAGKLTSGVSEADRTPQTQPFPWPNPAVPLMFIQMDKTVDEPGPLKLSYRNTAEAAVVVDCVIKLLEGYVSSDDIGIISPYKAQCEYISSRIARHAKLGLGVANAIEVSSVDKFQGREKKYIIHSCVRCNEARDIGFMYDPRRLNVSITRARYGLIFVGDVSTLWFATAHVPGRRGRQPTIWRPLIERFAHTGNLVRQQAGGYVPYTPFFLNPEQK